MKLTHLSDAKRPVMVNVTGKEPMFRTAVATGCIKVSEEVMVMLETGGTPKGSVLNTAVVAGIQAAKRTWELIPMCHPLVLEHAGIDFETGADFIRCTCSVAASARTGFEMEALMGVSVSLLTIYDMLKAVDKSMVINDVHLVSKTKEAIGKFVN
jgi:cyclic pyranopterin monophosphate synthase